MKLCHVRFRHHRRAAGALAFLGILLLWRRHQDQVLLQPENSKILQDEKEFEPEAFFEEQRDKINARIERRQKHKLQEKADKSHKRDEHENEHPLEREQRLMFEDLEKDPGFHKISAALPYYVYDKAPSANVNPNLKKLRLEDIDPSTAIGWPKLVEGVGNYENNPTLPKVGSPGHRGPGEGAEEGVKLLSTEEKLRDEMLHTWGFDMVRSAKVSLDRVTRDLRLEECQHWDYPAKLPAVSVVIVFHNEGFTTLMRTVHSVLNHSPPELIHEIVLFNDGSTRDYIVNGTLKEYLTRFNGIVKMFNSDRREGLIRARTLGGKHATGSVLVYLDAHCEPMQNWLPPLITPIVSDYRISTVPMVDGIHGDDYIIDAQAGGDENGMARGAWDWNLDWKRIPLNDREKARRSHISEPYRSPAMAGGLFAISKKWFEELGWYDDGLEIWGAENYELSYKLWQCHGQLLFVPCSRVGHIYRMEGWQGNETPDRLMGKQFIAINFVRVIETWWDSYKPFFYEKRPEWADVSPGDLSAVLAVREKLKCKSFEWFMKEIAYDVTKYYPIHQPAMVAKGKLMNVATQKCVGVAPYRITSNGVAEKDPVVVDDCDKVGDVTLSWLEDLSLGDGVDKNKRMCIDAEMAEHPFGAGRPKCMGYWQCHKLHGPQFFKYDDKTMQLYNPSAHSCLALTSDDDPCLHYVACDKQEVSTKQQWFFTGGVDKEAHDRVMKNRWEPGALPPELDYIDSVEL